MTNDVECLFVGLLVIFNVFFCGVSTHIFFFLAQFLLGIVLLLSCRNFLRHYLDTNPISNIWTVFSLTVACTFIFKKISLEEQ